MYRVGEAIPLRLQGYFDDERIRLLYAAIFTNGARLGYASDCPPNVFCSRPDEQQINSVLSFYQNRGLKEDWGTWTGAPPGLHVLEATSMRLGISLSVTRRVIVTDVVADEEPQFILPAPDSQFPIGELVPIELTMIMPETGGYGSLSVVADGEIIGHLSDCPPDADCGLPEPGSVVRLKFYPVDLRDPWDSWRPRKLGSHTLTLAFEDPDTGELTFGETIEIQVTPERPPFSLISKPFLQLVPNSIPEGHLLEVSTNLIDWEPLALRWNTTALSLTPASVPTQFFRLSKP